MQTVHKHIATVAAVTDTTMFHSTVRFLNRTHMGILCFSRSLAMLMHFIT